MGTGIVSVVFNAGVCKFQGRYVMVFRNDYGEFGNPQLQGTNLGLAYSDDGIHWQVEPTPCWELPAVIEAVSPLTPELLEWLRHADME